MEVKINREIRNYTESMFFGLSLRQLIFSVLAVGIAIGLYFFLKPYVGTETVSWMCILGAAPFAAMGFVDYHGMTAEQFLWAWFRSEMLEPRRIIFEPVNLYYELMKKNIRVSLQDCNILGVPVWYTLFCSGFLKSQKNRRFPRHQSLHKIAFGRTIAILKIV